jgi:two-component sensor histidine kinase
VVRALEIVEELVRTGKASRPYPHGLSILNGADRTYSAPDGTKRALDEVARLRAQQAALAAFGTYALGEYDLDKILAEAARLCASGLNVPLCKICRYRPAEHDLLIETGVGWLQGIIGQVVSVADASTPQGRAFSTKQPVICQDLRRDTSYILPAFYREHAIISTVDVIIQSIDGTPYGVLEVDSPTQHDYDEHDIAFLTGFANVVAEAVSTSRRRSAMELSIRRMKDIIDDRERLIEAKNSLLDEKTVLARELNHRVRNNLQLIHLMLTRRAPSGYSGDRMAGIARRVMALAQVYENLLGSGLSNTIDFGAYVDSLCKDTEAAVEKGTSTIRLACHPIAVQVDLDTATGLGLAASELIANCYAHAFPGRDGSIDVSVSRNDDTGIVTVYDNGIGLVEPTNDKSHGIGLVRRLMQQIGGSAEVSSVQGTAWVLRFPLGKATAG